MEEDRQGLLGQADPDYIDFEAPEIQEDVLPVAQGSRATLGNQQRIVLKNPDGSLSHGKRSNGSSTENAPAANPQQNAAQMLETVQRVQDEVEFVVSNFDFALEPGLALQNYLHHRKIVTILLSLNLVYELGLIVYVLMNRDFILAQLGEIYRNSSMYTIQNTFMVCYGVDLLASGLAYGYGYSALYSHKVNQYNTFNFWLLLCIFAKIVVSYLNVLNLLVFIMKLVMYLYARFLLSVLYTVLVIPRDLQIPSQREEVVQEQQRNSVQRDSEVPNISTQEEEHS